MIVHLISGLYNKPITIVNDNSKVVNKLETSLTDDASVVIYDCHMFIVQATGGNLPTVAPNSSIVILSVVVA